VRAPGHRPGEAGEGIPAGTELSLSLRYIEGRPALTRLMQQFTPRREAGIELRLSEVYASVLVAQTGRRTDRREPRGWSCPAGTELATTTRPREPVPERPSWQLQTTGHRRRADRPAVTTDDPEAL